MPFTDKIAISRQLAWNVVSSNVTAIDIRPPIGGANGTLLVQLKSVINGNPSAFPPFALTSEGLNEPTLPPHFTGYSDPAFVGGRPFLLRVLCETGQGDADAAYETSTDSVNWAVALTAFPNAIDTGTYSDPLNPLFFFPDEKQADYVRLFLDGNSNDDAIPCDVRVIAG